MGLGRSIILCAEEEEPLRPYSAVSADGPRLRSGRRIAPTPVLTMPRLPKLVPGKPLDPSQRKELVALQQQIQVQLTQQRVLVESIRQLPQFRDLSRLGAVPLDEVIARMRAGRHVVGPDPIGDSPAQDAEVEDGCLSQRGDAAKMDDANSTSTLGTTKKVFVDLHRDDALARPPVQRAGDEGIPDELGGPSPEDDDVEPRLLTPRSLSTSNLISLDEICEAACSENLDERTSPRSYPVQQVPSHPVPMQPHVPGGPTRVVPVPVPINERQSLPPVGALSNQMVPAESHALGTCPPGRDERRWIEAAMRRMFRSLGPPALESLTEAFREWKLPAAAVVVRQAAPISTGPGLCVLFAGVVDVLHRPKGSTEAEKVCTYDRCGQCFGELELFYEPPRGVGGGRKEHWATIATRTPVTLWTVGREVLRGQLSRASANCAESGVESGVVGVPGFTVMS